MYNVHVWRCSLRHHRLYNYVDTEAFVNVFDTDITDINVAYNWAELP